MRIISDFHDYYDCVQKQGQDQSLLYIRRSSSENLLKKAIPSIRYDHWFSGFPFPTEYVIGVCDKIYPMLYFDRGGIDNDPKRICYNVQEVDDYVKNKLKKKAYEGIFLSNTNNWKLSRKYNISPNFTKKGIELFFQQTLDMKQDLLKFFDDGQPKRYPTPIFTIYNSHNYNKSVVTYNDNLKDLGFYRVLDTQTMFQEISMYLGGLASPEKEIPHIPDKIMVEAKGFDKDWSFRKMPTKYNNESETT